MTHSRPHRLDHPGSHDVATERALMGGGEDRRLGSGMSRAHCERLARIRSQHVKPLNLDISLAAHVSHLPRPLLTQPWLFYGHSQVQITLRALSWAASFMVEECIAAIWWA